MAGAELHSLGIGHLASGVFVSRSRPDPAEILGRWTAVESPTVRGEYARDARVLLESPLSSDDLAFLWCACGSASFQPARDGVAGRAWLETVYEITCRDSDPALIGRMLNGTGDPALMARVELLIGQYSLPEHLAYQLRPCAGDADDIRRVLSELNGSGQPDLAFRLFILLAWNSLMQISAELFAEIAAVSAVLGHPDDLLDGVDPAQ